MNGTDADIVAAVAYAEGQRTMAARVSALLRGRSVLCEHAGMSMAENLTLLLEMIADEVDELPINPTRPARSRSSIATEMERK